MIFAECPECKGKQRIKNDVRAFPQNKYILINIKKKLEDSVKEIAPREVAKCEEHRRELILLCKRSECQKAVCNKCLTKSHRERDVVIIGEAEKETLLTKIKMIVKNLEKRKQAAKVVKSTMNGLYENCVLGLETHEERCMKLAKERFKTLRKTVEKQKLELDNGIFQDLNSLDQYQQLLRTTQENIDDDVATEAIADNLDTVHSIEESLKSNLAGEKNFQFSKYYPRQDILEHKVEILCDHLVKSERKLSEITAASGFR